MEVEKVGENKFKFGTNFFQIILAKQIAEQKNRTIRRNKKNK